MPASNLAQLGALLQYTARGAQQAQGLSNQLPPTYGEIVDVSDPENRGRVKVILDEVNPKILEEKGFSQGGAAPSQSDWIEPLNPFKGIQPKALVGTRVPIMPRNGDPNRLSFGAPVHDPAEKQGAKPPANSDMTRLSVYPSGSLPAADAENVGCMVVETGGPQGYDWLNVCLKRAGGYKWVRMADRLHYHTGQLPDTDNDSEGNGPDTSTEKRTYDDIIVTTGAPKEGSD